MASKSTLLALTVVAAALAAVVALDTPGPGGPARSGARLLPELEQSKLEEVSIARREGPALSLVRSSDGAFAAAGHPAAVLDPVALADLEATLRLLTYRRAVSAGSREQRARRGLDPPRLTLSIALESGAEVILEIGDRLPGADQYWLRRSGRDRTFLVEGYAARAMDRGLVDLRSRNPLGAKPDEVTGVEIHANGRALVLGGKPMAVHLEGVGGSVRAAPGAVRELLRRLDDLRIREFAAGSGAPQAEGSLSVRVVGSRPAQELQVVGPCPGDDELVLATTSVGDGCVERSQTEAIAAYAGAETELFDRRLIGAAAPREISFATASAPWGLERRGKSWFFGSPDEAKRADDVAVREWVEAVDGLVSGAGEIGALPPGGDDLLAGVVVAYPDGRSVRLGLRGRGRALLLRRGDEPVSWPVGAEAQTLLTAPAVRFRMRQLLSLEPYSMREAERWRDGRLVERIERGELLEEWRALVPEGGRVHLPVVAELRQAGSDLRAVRFAAAAPSAHHGLTPPRLRVEMTFDPPPVEASSEPLRHTVAIGRETKSGGCYAELDADPAVFELSRAHCQALRGPWTTR